MLIEERVPKIIELLERDYPDAYCSLAFEKDYELLFSVRLAAQCTDERVNKVTPALFQRFPTLESFASAEVSQVEECIRSCGFFRAKAKDIVLCAQAILTKHGGRVPGSMDELLALPGVGRKTANLILGDVFGQPAIVVDTHCIRLSGRIGLVKNQKDPVKIEYALRELLPPEKSSNFCHRLVIHGRAVCTARSPKCGACSIREFCDYNNNNNA